MNANLFLHSSPEYYEIWLAGAVEQTIERFDLDERFVFVNAWNEWAEGTHLEPDRKYGRKFLEATKNVMLGNSSVELLLEMMQHTCKDSRVRDNINRIKVELDRRKQVSNYLLRMAHDAPAKLYSRSQFPTWHSLGRAGSRKPLSKIWIHGKSWH